MVRGTRVALQMNVEVEADFPVFIDEVAERADASRGFLRAAWYAAGRRRDGRTLVARGTDGAAVAALPLTPIKPFLPKGRAVAGSYWPFRAPVLAADACADACADAVAAMVAHRAARRLLSPLWRMGPVYDDDPGAVMLLRALRDGGWTVLTRRLGTAWRFDLRAAAAAGAWPRKSTLKRLRSYQRQLGEQGEVRLRMLSGAQWDADMFDVLRGIESRSWVGTDTDGQGAKFLTDAQRAHWRDVVRDPWLAARLSVTVLHVGDRAIAFSFDLRSGPVQYSIASSYDRDYAAWRPGKIVTYHQFGEALEQGVETIDLGAGDGGYKREIGARPGPAIHDYLIVRHRPLAALLRRRWESGGDADADVDGADGAGEGRT